MEDLIRLAGARAQYLVLGGEPLRRPHRVGEDVAQARRRTVDATQPSGAEPECADAELLRGGEVGGTEERDQPRPQESLSLVLCLQATPIGLAVLRGTVLPDHDRQITACRLVLRCFNQGHPEIERHELVAESRCRLAAVCLGTGKAQVQRGRGLRRSNEGRELLTWRDAREAEVVLRHDRLQRLCLGGYFVPQRDPGDRGRLERSRLETVSLVRALITCFVAVSSSYDPDPNPVMVLAVNLDPVHILGALEGHRS